MFPPAECVRTSANILCQNAGRSATLQIKLKGEASGKAPFKLKLKSDMSVPPYFLGPFTLRIEDIATSVNREGAADHCSTSPVK